MKNILMEYINISWKSMEICERPAYKMAGQAIDLKSDA